MRSTTTLVDLDYPCARRRIVLSRTPRHLRFVIKGNDWKTLDALDQLDDEPEADETVFAAVLKSRGSVHYDGIRNGKRFGEWHHTATYSLVQEQPTQEVLRGTSAWQAWCTARAQSVP